MEDTLPAARNEPIANCHCPSHRSSHAQRCAGAATRHFARPVVQAVVAIFWVGIALAGFDVDLANLVSLNPKPPPRMKAYAADRALRAAFPEQAEEVASLLLVHTHDGTPGFLEPSSPGKAPVLCEITSHIRRHLAAEVGVGGTNTSFPLSMMGFCTLNHALPALAQKFIDGGGRSSYLKLTARIEPSLNQPLARTIRRLIHDLEHNYKGFFFGSAGLPTMILEATESVQKDIRNMDYVVPIAFLVMLTLVQSLRLLALPLVCMFVSMKAAMLCIFFAHKFGMEINSSVPSFMLAMQIALSIDYALFLLTRLREELGLGASMSDAVAVTLACSGKTIVGSGFTLILCFVSLLSFPVPLLQGLGVAITIAVFAAMLVNLTLMPVLLLAFPNFFGSSVGCRGTHCLCLPGIARFSSTLEGNRDPSFGGDPRALQASLSAPIDRIPSSRSECLPKSFRIAHLTTSPLGGLFAICLLFLVLVPGGMLLARMKYSSSTLLVVPRFGSAAATMSRLEGVFPGGLTTPYMLLMRPMGAHHVHKDAIWKGGFWSEATSLIDSISHLGDGATIMSPMWSTGSPVNGMDSTFLRNILQAPGDAVCDSFPKKHFAACVAFRHISGKAINANSTAVVATIVTDNPVGSVKAEHFTRRLRRLLEEFDLQAIHYELAGQEPIYADIVHSVYSRLPMVLGVTLTVVLGLIGYIYKSVIIALRGLVTIAFTIAFSFGLAVGIYQYGWLERLHIERLSNDGALAWLVPPVAFAVILGLALDYDIFLVGRIMEFREAGFSDRDAIDLGLWKTGKVITTAGVIMAIAYAGIMFSEVPMMNQSALLLVVAVLLDTFVVRSVLVPALMACLGAWNWWPMQPAPATQDAQAYVLMHNGGAKTKMYSDPHVDNAEDGRI